MSKKSSVDLAGDDARAAMLSSFLKEENRKSAGSVTTYDGAPLVVESVSTGAMTLDLAIGSGGIPRGRITEIYGPESVGKTSLALQVAANAIRDGGTAALVDVEHAITPGHLKAMGVDPSFLAISQPSSGEEAFERMERMLEADLFDVVILDSVAFLTPQAELDGEMTDQHVGLQARLVGKGLRKVSAKVRKSNAAVIFINQLRHKIGGYGNPEDTPGGKSLKYMASLRVDLRSPASARIPDPQDRKAFIGMQMRARTVKNKVAPPHREALFNLIWGQGIDFRDSVVEAAKELGVITGDGAHRYTVAATGKEIVDASGVHVRGFAKVKEAVAHDDVLAEELTALCYAKMRDAQSDLSLDDEPIGDEVFADDA